MEREEYNSDTNPYPSFGKKYNGEKAIISMTSWTARISTCSKTIFSLLKQCPGFHLVLVLAEEEFPKMIKELPENLMLFVDNELIELMFVRKNYKSFKKVLFTMDKYRDVPVISADDDCIYTCNYAQMLYDEWKNNKKCIITNNGNYQNKTIKITRGPNTLFFYSALSNIIKHLNEINFLKLNDDAFYSACYLINQIKIIDLKLKPFYIFHTSTAALSKKIKYNALSDVSFYFKQLKGFKCL